TIPRPFTTPQADTKLGCYTATRMSVAQPHVPVLDSESALLAEIAGKENLDDAIPTLARDARAMGRVEAVVQRLETRHELILGDSRRLGELRPSSVHLVVTSPPYWTLKRYNDHRDQLGHVADYDEFIAGLDEVWGHCFRALVPGGRLVCVVGDVCLSRRKNNGRHTVVPLHATIQEHCKQLGFDNLDRRVERDH